jgi:hypothetical protein
VFGLLQAKRVKILIGVSRYHWPPIWFVALIGRTNPFPTFTSPPLLEEYSRRAVQWKSCGHAARPNATFLRGSGLGTSLCSLPATALEAPSAWMGTAIPSLPPPPRTKCEHRPRDDFHCRLDSPSSGRNHHASFRASREILANDPEFGSTSFVRRAFVFSAGDPS